MPSFVFPAAIRSVISRPADRHRGFINSNRRMLAMGAVCASGLLASIYAMPASAEVLHEEVVVSQLQTYVAPSFSTTPAVTRDDFAITEYTVVQWPVPATTEMSSGFGYRSCTGCSADHLGIDLNPGEGYPIQAIADGVVVLSAEDAGGLGVHVVIEHTVNGNVVRSLYAHMQYGSATVAVGQTVSRGQQLGLVGSTGASTGPHLHFGILIDGVEVDPQAWLLTNVTE